MELPKRKLNRLTEYNYNTPNAYFITICTKDRKNLFWHNVGAIIDRPENVPLTGLGTIVHKRIEDIPKYYPAISVDHFCDYAKSHSYAAADQHGCRRAINDRPYNINGSPAVERNRIQTGRLSSLAKRFLRSCNTER